MRIELKDRYTITSIENRVNGKIGIPPQVLRVDKKTNMPPQVKIANISDFQSLGIINLECISPDNLKNYIH